MNKKTVKVNRLFERHLCIQQLLLCVSMQLLLLWEEKQELFAECYTYFIDAVLQIGLSKAHQYNRRESW